MIDQADEDAVRHRAYAIWEREGRPDGEHESHWKLALAELGLLDPSKVLTPKESRRNGKPNGAKVKDQPFSG